MTESLIRTIVQLVQVPMHTVLVVLLVYIAYRAKLRGPWLWMLASCFFVVLRRVASLYWVQDPLHTLQVLDQAVLPVLISSCQLVWALQLCRNLDRATDGR